MRVNELFEDKDLEADLKKTVVKLKQQMADKGIVRFDALDLSSVDKKYHDIVIHGISKGTNTKGWKDFFAK